MPDGRGRVTLASGSEIWAADVTAPIRVARNGDHTVLVVEWQGEDGDGRATTGTLTVRLPAEGLRVVATGGGLREAFGG